MMPYFAHHVIHLLPGPGAAGGCGSRAHLDAVKSACESADYIHRVLKLAGRFELALIPAAPDFFDPSPKLAKARALAWETIRLTLRLQWVILTPDPEFISQALPQTWIGKGFRNVCAGFLADGSGDFTGKLHALRNAPLQFRMILLTPSSRIGDLGGLLDRIDWVVYAGTPDDASEVAAIQATCGQANVPFLFAQPHGGIGPGSNHDTPIGEPPLAVHPFGDKIQLLRPTLPDLLPAPNPEPSGFIPPAHPQDPQKTPSAAVMKSTTQPAPSATPTPPIDTAPDATVAPPEPHGPPINSEPEVSAAPPEPPAQAALLIVASPDPDSAPPAVNNVEEADFKRLDSVIRRGLGTFVEVGSALVEVRDRELWHHGGYSSWAAYCQAVGGLTKQHANRLILSAGIVQNIAEVEPIGSTLLPRTESQVRPLGRLATADQRSAAWKKAVQRASGQPTAKDVTIVVAELLGDKKKKPTAIPDKRKSLVATFKRLRNAVNGCDHEDRVAGLISELERVLKLV